MLKLTDEEMYALNEAVENWQRAGQPTCSEEAIFGAGIAYERERNKWQPVETCPSDVVVLLYSPKLSVYQSERVEARVFHDTRGGHQHAWATHWQPLPEPPQ